MTEPDPDFAAFRVEMAEQRARTARLTGVFGKPEDIDAAAALALAAACGAADPAVNPDDVMAHVYRDGTAADGWLESNCEHHGHPTLAKVPLPDGRVVGILDLRAAFKRAREERS